MSDEYKGLKSKKDEELMELYQNGSSQAFDEIYNRYAKRIYGFFFKKGLVSIIAQDLTQEAFLKVHRSKNLYDKSLLFSPWVFSISRSIFLDFVKRKHIEDPTEPEIISNLADKYEETSKTYSQDRTDLNVLNILPENQQIVVKMRAIEEATFDEIADRLNTTPDNARQIFSRGIRKLHLNFSGKEKK